MYINRFDILSAQSSIYVSFCAPYIEKEGAGIYVDYNDTEGWKQAIRYLYTHPEEAQQMGANGRKLAEREYNLEHYSRELSQILTTTVKTYRKQP